MKEMEGKMQFLVNDILSRGYRFVKGDMNFDIIGKGLQLSGMRDLKPGDVMLKQGNWGESAATAEIGAGQTFLNKSDHRYFGAGLLGHAAIYVGNGKIVESGSSGVVCSQLDGYNKEIEADYKKYNWYVIRCNDEAVASEVAKMAKTLVGKVDYNTVGLIPAAVVGNNGPMSDAINSMRTDPTKSDQEKLKNGKKPKMFCSEFVVFVYNCVLDEMGLPRHISIQQDRISPEELYVALRDHSGYTYVGELHKDVR
jgi:hypothetical protein